MSRWTRREVLKTGLTASAGALAARRLNVTNAAANENESSFIQEPSGNQSPRERLLMDFGWRLQLGHANDPAKDFGFGLRRRESQFAKSGGFLAVTRVDFDDRQWREIDLPHDWAVELPFTDAPLVFHHGAKPVGREYPETSVGWYRRVFEIPKTDAGKRVAIEFDGAFRDAMVIPKEAKRSAFNGLCVLLVQALKESGEIRIEASAAELGTAATMLTVQPAKPRPAT